MECYWQLSVAAGSSQRESPCTWLVAQPPREALGRHQQIGSRCPAIRRPRARHRLWAADWELMLSGTTSAWGRAGGEGRELREEGEGGLLWGRGWGELVGGSGRCIGRWDNMRWKELVGKGGGRRWWRKEVDAFRVEIRNDGEERWLDKIREVNCRNGNMKLKIWYFNKRFWDLILHILFISLCLIYWNYWHMHVTSTMLEFLE